MASGELSESTVECLAEDGMSALGYATLGGTELDDAGERADAGQCILQGRLAAALHRLNPGLPHDTIEGVVRTLSRPPHPTLIQNNRWLHALLTDGVAVEYRDAKLSEMRDHLLPKLVSGAVRVRDTEHIYAAEPEPA